MDLKCPQDRQVRSEFRHSTGVDHPFFNNVRFDFVTLFAQLWLNVFCLRSQNELKNFHSALQISQWNDVNLLWEFSLTYNGLNDILISSNGLYFIFYFICQSYWLEGVWKPSFLAVENPWTSFNELKDFHCTDQGGTFFYHQNML